MADHPNVVVALVWCDLGSELTAERHFAGLSVIENNVGMDIAHRDTYYFTVCGQRPFKLCVFPPNSIHSIGTVEVDGEEKRLGDNNFFVKAGTDREAIISWANQKLGSIVSRSLQGSII